jgi:2-polyprenyl-3-methyl-5-hydroxy-6-metoxy-1,4-benzoquinol methylase
MTDTTKIPCPICGAASELFHQRLAFDTRWNIHKCPQCGHGFVSNRPTLDRLKEIYATDVNPAMEEISPAEHERRPDARMLIRQITQLSSARGPSLDVGSGNAAFSYHLQKAGYTPLLIDLDPRAEPAARLVPNSTFRLVSFEEIHDKQSFDAIIMSQVLEHFIDPVDALRHARELLTEQGVLAVAVPNFGGLYKVLGRKDPFLTPPIHLNFFTPRSLELAMKHAGLHVVRWRSASRIALSPRFGIFKPILETLWNPVAGLLSQTSHGIILISLAKCA